MGKSIVITSGKGGVGKTTSSANIGTALALMGKRVCLVDLDIGLRNLDVVLGLIIELFTISWTLWKAVPNWLRLGEGQAV